MLFFHQPLNILITKGVNYTEIIHEVLFTETSTLKTARGDFNLGEPPILRGKEPKHPSFYLVYSRPS